MAPISESEEARLREIYEKKWHEIMQYMIDHPTQGLLDLETLNMNIAMKFRGYDRVPDIRKRLIIGEENWATDIMRSVNKLYANFDEMNFLLAAKTFFYFAKHSKQFRKFYDMTAYPIDAHYYNTPEFRKLMDEMVNEIIEREAKHFEIAD